MERSIVSGRTILMEVMNKLLEKPLTLLFAMKMLGCTSHGVVLVRLISIHWYVMQFDFEFLSTHKI